MSYKEITNIDELHNILLEIAKEFRRICDLYGIPYYMLGGTMLGAIRHNGFIPWDDDMDFGVPRQYYDKLFDVLESNLHFPYHVCSYKNTPLIYSPIIKIVDTRTVANDPCVPLSLDEQIGVNIDVFPLDYCKKNDILLNKIYLLEFVYQTIYVKNRFKSKWKNFIKEILSAICPISRIKLIERIHFELSRLNRGPMLANVLGAWKKKECIPIEWYGEGKKYTFEDTEFNGIMNYDSYLKQLYDDYMKPPKGDRHIHLSNVYWKV